MADAHPGQRSMEDTVGTRLNRRTLKIGHAVIRARFAQAAGDDAQTLADSNRPGWAAKADERETWRVLDDQAKALRIQQSRCCTVAADLMLRRARPMRGV